MPAINLAPQMVLLGSYEFPSAAATSPVLTIPACDLLQIQFNIEGYSGGGGIAAFRFNGDTTVTNYATEYLTWSTAAPTVANVLGTFGGFKTGANSVTVARSGFLTIKNFSSTSHLITCQSITHNGAGTVADTQSTGGGKFLGSGQITSVQMIVDTAVNVLTGTSFAVFGFNP
jgi:hypothetical protein